MKTEVTTLYEGSYWSPGSIALYAILTAIVIVLWVFFIRGLIYEDRHGRGIRGWIRRKKLVREDRKKWEQLAYENEMLRREQERRAKEEARSGKSGKATDSWKL